MRAILIYPPKQMNVLSVVTLIMFQDRQSISPCLFEREQTAVVFLSTCINAGGDLHPRLHIKVQ